MRAPLAHHMKHTVATQQQVHGFVITIIVKLILTAETQKWYCYQEISFLLLSFVYCDWLLKPQSPVGCKLSAGLVLSIHKL